MPHNSNVSPLTASLEALSQLIPNPNSVTISAANPASDFGRIADALERIAIALEKLTGEKSQLAPPVPITKLQPKLKPVQNPLPNTKPASQTQPKPIQKLPVAASSLPQVQPKPVQNPSPNDAKPFVAAEAAKVLSKHLTERGITVQVLKKKAIIQNQEALKQLALYLGQNFAICQELHQLVKQNMKTPVEPFEYSLKGANAERNKIIQKFCQLLHNADLLHKPFYEAKPEYNFRLKATGKEQDYLNGKWLESYVEQEVARIIRQNTKKPYEAMPNPKIKFQDGSETELDLFFAVGQKVFCVEAKMRRNNAILEKWLERVKPLGLADSRSILVVVANGGEGNCQEPVRNWGNVQFTGLDKLEETVISMLNPTV